MRPHAPDQIPNADASVQPAPGPTTAQPHPPLPRPGNLPPVAGTTAGGDGVFSVWERVVVFLGGAYVAAVFAIADWLSLSAAKPEQEPDDADQP